ncbi:MAG: DNRLRE domain-containing protein [Ignavibacteriaceae bacterium]|nr:DNRLRE domain-containing protein [Ignavibacteriaceae bacterium]
MIKHFVLFLLLISSLILISCSDDPSSVGLNLLEQDYLKVDTINSVEGNFFQTSSHFKKVISLGNSSRLLVGMKDNLTAYSIMNFAFFLPDSVKTDFNEGNIVIESAFIELYPNYVFTDSLVEFDFTVHKVLSTWSSSTFSADSFSTLQYDLDDVSSDKSFGDSVYSFKINNELAREWIDFSMNTDSLTNYGILISPTVSTQKIVGFQAYNAYLDADSKLKVIISKQGSYTDTLTGIVASDISLVLGDLPQTEPDYMLVQSSLAINSKLYFDLSSIPTNVVINRATLTLHSDSTKNVFGSSFENSLLAFLIKNEETNEVDENLFIRLSDFNYQYSGDITPMVRKWLRDNDNQGMILRSGSEQVGVELFNLFGSEALDPSKRPYLEIVYTYN